MNNNFNLNWIKQIVTLFGLRQGCGLNNKLTASLVIAASLFSLPASGATLWCTRKIQSVLMFSNGTVMIVGSWRADYTQTCSTQGAVLRPRRAWHGTEHRLKRVLTIPTLLSFTPTLRVIAAQIFQRIVRH